MCERADLPLAPFARTYECDLCDGPVKASPYCWVAITREDVDRIIELARDAACISGEVSIKAAGGRIRLSLDTFTVFS